MSVDSIPHATGDATATSVENVRVRGVTRLITPSQVKEQLPMSEATQRTVLEGRRAAQAIVRGEDPRLLLIIGPCSIHDTKAALEYAERLAALSAKIADRIQIVMRVYFEKPRTTIGWKGLINDPYLDDSCDIGQGILVARKLLLDITAMGLPAATEFLDPIIPQYIGDLISWAAIGARTTESQTHREMSSGLSMPVGFKNGTDGSVQTAIDAMRASQTAHSFLGIDRDGATSIIKTSGNPDCHLVLRGGRNGPNYAAEHILAATEKLRGAKQLASLMVDCSHANSEKDPQNQPKVWANLLDQRRGGRREIIGAMLESNLHAGNQPLPKDLSQLKYGVSITDGCIDWETTERILS